MISGFISVFDEESLTPDVLENLFRIVHRFSEIDSLKTLVLAEGGYRKIAVSFSNASKAHQSATVSQFRNLLLRGDDMRKQLAEGKDILLNALRSFVSVDAEELIGVCGIILALYSNSPDARSTVIETTGILFSAVKGNDAKKRNWALIVSWKRRRCQR